MGRPAFHLKAGRDFIQEYHVVDPFLADYDVHDPMSKMFRISAQHASVEEISRAWATAIAKDIGVDGLYLQEGMPPAGCQLRMYRLKSAEAAPLFEDGSVDAVFVDGLHTYDGVTEDIQAWRNKVKKGGSLIFNDFNDEKMFPGVKRAVEEEAKRQGLNVLMIDKTNALLGGSRSCVCDGSSGAQIPRNGCSGYHW